MKRLVCILFTAILLISSGLALADTPKPIVTIPFDQLPETIPGQHHYLLLCVDQWHGKSWNLGNTDGIVLVTLDTRAHRVMLTSFIRDSLVTRPDGVIGRINYIAKNYGTEALCKVISEHIGVKIEKYILFDFSQLQTIINELGGVDITISSEESNYLTRYAIPRNSTKPQLNGRGTYHFNGHAAVIYMRIRKAGGGGDFMRTQRVRTVLSTLADSCRNISYDDARHLVDAILDNTTLTNITLEEAVQAMEYAYSLRDCTIEELRIPPDGAVHALSYAGMAAQEIDWPVCRETMADYLENSFLVYDEDQQDDDLTDFGDFGDLDF